MDSGFASPSFFPTFAFVDPVFFLADSAFFDAAFFDAAACFAVVFFAVVFFDDSDFLTDALVPADFEAPDVVVADFFCAVFPAFLFDAGAAVVVAVAVRKVLLALAALFWRRDGFFVFVAGAFVAPVVADVVEFGFSELPDVLSLVRLVACGWLMCTSIASSSNQPGTFSPPGDPRAILGYAPRADHEHPTQL